CCGGTVNVELRKTAMPPQSRATLCSAGSLIRVETLDLGKPRQRLSKLVNWIAPLAAFFVEARKRLILARAITTNGPVCRRLAAGSARCRFRLIPETAIYLSAHLF